MGSVKGLKPLEIASLADRQHDPVMLGERHRLHQCEIEKFARIVMKAGERDANPRGRSAWRFLAHDRIPLHIVQAKIAVLANMGRTYARPQKAESSKKRHCP